MASQKRIVGIRWLNKRELRSVLNARAKRVLGMSGAAFQKQFRSGKLGAKSLDGTAGTIDLAALCSFTGGKRARSNRKRSRK